MLDKGFELTVLECTQAGTYYDDAYDVHSRCRLLFVHITL